MANDFDGKSILLIDADVRRGRVAHYLDIERSPGLTDILKGEIEPDDVFVSPGIDNFTIIPSGKVTKNPAELLGSKRCGLLWRHLNDQIRLRPYRYAANYALDRCLHIGCGS